MRKAPVDTSPQAQGIQDKIS